MYKLRRLPASSRLTFIFLVCSIVGAAVHKSYGAPFESTYFAIHSESAGLNRRQIEQIAQRLDEALENVSRFLGFRYDFEKRGKIYVEIRPGAGVPGTTPDLRIFFYSRGAAQGLAIVHEVTHI